jgi:hypothetical protein
VQLVTLAVVIVILIACCNLPAWPTFVWQVVGHDCGTVQVGMERVTSSDAAQAETCFAQAYQRCAPATISASFVDLDYSARYTFVIEPYGFTCAVGALWNVGRRSPLGNAGVGYCGGVRLQADGLHVLGCQQIGDVGIPSA